MESRSIRCIYVREQNKGEPRAITRAFALIARGRVSARAHHRTQTHTRTHTRVCHRPSGVKAIGELHGAGHCFGFLGSFVTGTEVCVVLSTRYRLFLTARPSSRSPRVNDF